MKSTQFVLEYGVKPLERVSGVTHRPVKEADEGTHSVADASGTDANLARVAGEFGCFVSRLYSRGDQTCWSELAATRTTAALQKARLTQQTSKV